METSDIFFIIALCLIIIFGFIFLFDYVTVSDKELNTCFNDGSHIFIDYENGNLFSEEYSTENRCYKFTNETLQELKR